MASSRHPAEQPERGQRRGPNPELFAPFLPPPPPYRAGDTDRERVTELLSQAMSAGQLDVGEFDQRAKAVYSAKTHAELEAITRDLVVRPRTWRFAHGRDGGPGRTTLFAVLGGLRRQGEWAVPARINIVVFWGGGLVDLRHAVFHATQTRIWVWAIMGGVKIIVPSEAGLQVRGGAIMAGFSDKASGPGEPGQPQIEVQGFSFWGGVAVVREHITRNTPLSKRLRGR
ncbi:DUF1707 SHOCT-like domain-containing protein [Segniliparus rotundus]|nr:DUF1707 domain-containing protein [Segniliparus rotundus]